jgi:hypothetical protein
VASLKIVLDSICMSRLCIYDHGQLHYQNRGD